MAVNELLADKKLLGLAIEALYEETGLKLRPYDEPLLDDRYFDATLGVEGYDYLTFNVEIKPWFQQANLGAIINKIKELPGNGMLVADYVNPNMAEKLRKLDVPFIDARGNAYINEKPLYIFVTGNKNPTENKLLKPQALGRAFQAKGLKVVYELIRAPELVNAAYRDIADIAGVALGTVGWVVNDLKQEGYLIEYGKKQRRLKNRKQLLNKWVDAYLQKLRPKLLLGTFASDNPYWWLDVDDNITDYGARWGGEVAAAKYTGHLKPEDITIYLLEDKLRQLLTENRLRKDPQGHIQIYKAFWNAEKWGQDYRRVTDDLNGCVDPIIAYADLLATSDPRNLETARMLYDEKLVRLVQGD